MSVWSKESDRKVALPAIAEREAIRLVAGVGGTREWWIYNSAVLVGHLRIPVTVQEHDQIPPGSVVADAGDSGPPRGRTRL